MSSFSHFFPFESIPNFRELGGCPTQDGRKVRKGLFYRSAHLANVTEKDRELFESLGIRYILDFRSDWELKEAPDVRFEHSQYLHLDAFLAQNQTRPPDDNFFRNLIESGNMDMMGNLLCDQYLKLPFSNPAYRKMFELVKKQDELPILLHCFIGRDRTGVASALILLLLGASEQTICDEYLISNEGLGQWRAEMLESAGDSVTDENREKANQALLVKKEYISSIFPAILGKYHDYDAYFQHEFGINPEIRKKLQKQYLED